MDEEEENGKEGGKRREEEEKYRGTERLKVKEDEAKGWQEIKIKPHVLPKSQFYRNLHDFQWKLA